MSKRISFAFLAVALCLHAASAFAQKATFFVAPNGNDAWSGRLAEPNAGQTDGPFAGIVRARDAVRDLQLQNPKSKIQNPVTVTVRGGTYYLSEPLRFRQEDSGTADCPVTYTAYPGEKPVLSGGKIVAGWKKDQGNVWAAEAPGVKEGKWYFRQLFVNGRRACRARTPNDGYLKVEDLVTHEKAEWNKGVDRFKFSPGDLKAWPNPTDIEVVVFHSWNTSRVRIASVDEKTCTVTFTGPTVFRPKGWDPNQRYYVENVFEALDSPGEWYLDRQKGVVYYWPLPAEDMSKAEVIAPALTDLVRFEGDAEMGLPVEHIALRGLSFQHADWTLPEKGYGDPQAAVTVPAVISATGALHCAVEECEVAHVGTYGIWFARGCKDNRIAQNHLHDLGAGGVRIGEDKMAKEDAAEAARNLVHNNYIHDGGRVYAAGVGVWVAQSSQNTISHNEIHDLDYSGMSIGWNWSDAPNRTHHNTIEFNHIHHVMRGVLSDGGGIYTLGSQPGSILRGNVIHDVFSYDKPTLAWGIYLDQDSNGLLIENNLCYNTHTGGIMLMGGHDDIVRNNIFARGAHDLIWRSGKKGMVFERNICCVTQGALFYPGAQDMLDPAWDRNLYFRADAQPLLFYEDTFDEWKARGVDAHSLVADPLFVNADACDFRLRPDSPAFKLGFTPFDFAKAGLEGPREWTDLPRSAVFKPTVLPPAPPPPQPTPVDDGFETTPVGEPPALATVSGEENAASIRVTEDLAAAGKRSLKITDAPGLSHDWEPHFFYRPNFKKGVARCSFDLRLEKGATLSHEWRDWRKTPFDVGPSIRVDAMGRVRANGRDLAVIPIAQWVRFEITCPLGEQATGKYDLTITPPGGKPQTFAGLNCGAAKFKTLTWVGFISTATEKTVFHLDNLRIQD